MSWGHKIVSASERERTWGCTGGRRCEHPVIFRGSYRYQTGRRGNVAVRDLYLCEEHGKKFATKNELELPDASQPGTDSPTRLAREAFVNAFLGSMPTVK